MGNCAFSSDDTSCGSAIGNCKNSHCASSCTKKVQEESIKIEEVVDAMLKSWVENHLHGHLREYLSSPVARQIEEGLKDVINIDIIPRLSVDVIQKNASKEESIISPSNI